MVLLWYIVQSVYVCVINNVSECVCVGAHLVVLMLSVVWLSEVIMSKQWLRQQKELWGAWASCHFMTLCSSNTRGRVFLNLMCDFCRWQIQHGPTSYITRQICVCIDLYNSGNQHGSFRLCFTLSPHATWGCCVILVAFNCSKIIKPLSLAPEEILSLAEMEDTLLRNLFRGYQKWVRPVLHANDTITVRFGLKISQLVDVVRHTHTHLHRNIWSSTKSPNA